ncbi:hypothetical protein AF335_18130 [Streptomyces eurocidicus]|uniref:Uncharacterized protein n=1 Tax=Streptomyces eurocidicus TaxID=66423 RepID=A0A2N8NUP9_STREU|nr:hypothetical protein [Streptomyces eurocidicus]MBB5121310.1 hypothetical protein [Streptomyces eurocidicus]MBF6055915.1 hypothetical protein [Streptomyces eurocidicus]PNE32496.1 hypothetical protein AF335_18130 [Streptomyces eurocidicus]
MTSSTSRPAISVEWEGETIIVSNVERDLPAPSTGDERGEVLTAGAANPMVPLPADAWHAVARAVVTPETVAMQLRPSKSSAGGLLMEEHVEGATLRSVLSKAWLFELFPGIQPRTGMEAMEVPDPRVEGTTDDGQPCTLLRYTYKDFAHLKRHVWQTVQGTLALNSYAPSILSRKVTRALITHPVEFAFEDGTESVYGLVVRDGITRLASAWKVLAGPESDADKAATTAVQALFGTVSPARHGEGKPLTQRIAASREARRTTLANEFARGWAGSEPTLRAIQIAQTFVVPVQITVGAQQHAGGGPALAAEDLFDDAMRSILASVHLEFKEWSPAAQNVEVATRALKRVMQLGLGSLRRDELQVVYGLAVGRTLPEELPKEYGDDAIPGTALWRAVYLVHSLAHPGLFGPLKEQSKAIKGDRRMSDKGFAALLGPIVDHPWRNKKRDVTKQARNAWANGGVLTKDVLTRPWRPVPTTDFTSLVKAALRGDDNARGTLAVAGGIALIADKMLTRNVGSALMAPKEKGGVPFRANVNDVIGDLARQDNELGLWTLALAAQRFEVERLPRNSATALQIIRKPAETDQANDYVHVVVDLSASDRIARDAAGQPLALTQWDVVWASDERRARKEVARRNPPAAPQGAGALPRQNAAGAALPGTSGAASSDQPAAQLAADNRRTLKDALDDARHALDELTRLEPELGTWPPLFTTDSLKQLHTVAQDLKHDLYQRLKALNDAVEQEEQEEREEEEEAEDGLAESGN